MDNRRGGSANNTTMASISVPPEQKLRSDSVLQAQAEGGSEISGSTLKNETVSKKAFALQDKVIFIL